jgi:hypothetical protein
MNARCGSVTDMPLRPARRRWLHIIPHVFGALTGLLVAATAVNPSAASAAKGDQSLPYTARPWTNYEENDVGPRGLRDPAGPRGHHGPAGRRGPRGFRGPPGRICPSGSNTPTFSLSSLPAIVLAIDAVFALFFAIYVIMLRFAWGQVPQPAGGTDPRELDRATAFAGTFITINVAGAALLLAGIGVLLGLHQGDCALRHAPFTELTLGAIWLGISLLASVVTASQVLTKLHKNTSVARDANVMTSGGAQMFAMVIGGIYFLTSFFLL